MIKTSTQNQKQFSWITTSGILSALLFILFFGGIAKAQLVYNESFESTPMLNTPTLALGWAQGKYGPGVDPDNFWDRRTIGLYPATAPHSGNGMMRYFSYLTTAGEASFLASKRLDMRSMPAGGSQCSFWMHREAGWAGYPDRVQVYYNSTPDMNGTPVGPIAEIGSSALAINRDCNLAPTATCGTWVQYNYPILQAGNNTANFYVIIVATSGFGNDIHIDDFSITTYPVAQTFTSTSAAVITQNINTTGPSQVNQNIIGVRFTMSGAVLPKALTNMIFNTNGSTSPPSDIANAKLWFSGGTNTFSTDNAILLGTYNQPWSTNDTFLCANWVNGAFGYNGLTTFSGLEHGDNYFFLTYNIRAGAVSGDYVDAEWLDFEIATVAAATTVPQVLTLAGNRLIDLVYCVPSYAVGTSWAGYQTNDFVNNVICVGDNIPPPGISNNLNWTTGFAGPLCPGTAPRTCPFQSHPPDYETFAEVAGKTTSFTADGTTNYPISIQCGTYGGGNVVAAWIDYNKDGIFNNWFMDVNITATGLVGQNTITLTAAFITHPGWKIGMNISGTGIAPGATIQSVAGNVITLSALNIGAVSGVLNCTTTDGEKISQSQGLGALGTYVASFKVPNTAVSGKTRMRVREVWIDYNIDPCAYRTYGECEDYIVTVIPDCPGIANWTTWLGLTSNWADPSNWCPAVAPINGNPDKNVRIPGGPSGAYTYVRPRIEAGVLARANTLRVEANDTIYIDATAASSLTVNDTVLIQTPTSAIKINTTYIDTAQLLNGTFNKPVDSPLNTSQRSRSFLLIPQADLLLQGLLANDNITKVKFHLKRMSNGNPYKGLTIKMYMTPVATNLNPSFTGVIPPVFGAAPLTVFSGDINTATFVGAVGGFGTITIPLTTPYVWDGSANQVVVEMCYDNTGFAATGANDEIRFTQTTSLRKYMCIESLSTRPISGCAMIPNNVYQAAGTASGTIGGTTITVSAADVPNIYPGALIVSNPYNAANGNINGVSVVNVVGTTVNITGGTVGATFAGGSLTFFDVNNTVSNFRPNVSFEFDRPYIRYPIYVGEHWINNGTFVAGKSKVTFGAPAVSPIANQQIMGANSTTFYDLEVNNATHVMRVKDFTVTDTLWLTAGRLKLNNGLVTLTNPSPGAITRTGGFIQAETDALASNVAPYGRLRWQMGSVAGPRVIPFANPANAPLFMDYYIDSGTHDVILGTFNTAPSNLNLPLPEVTNVFGYNGSAWNSDGSATIDRFFFVKDSLGVAPQADITFRWAVAERSFNNPTGALPMSAQRWLTATDYWEFPFIAGQAPALDQVQVQNFTGFNANQWWTVVGSNTPLPVSLLEFSADQYKDRVKLKWSTASELNNSHFEIERTTDNSAFDFIGRVESRGPGNNIQNYETWDNNPLEGIQYYYLRQYDRDGTLESYGPVSAKFNHDIFDIVTTTISSTDKGLTVVFNYNSNEPYSYRIMDMTGRVIVAQDRNAAVEGINVIDIDAKLAKGAYHIVLQNSEKVVSRKFFY